MELVRWLLCPHYVMEACLSLCVYVCKRGKSRFLDVSCLEHPSLTTSAFILRGEIRCWFTQSDPEDGHHVVISSSLVKLSGLYSAPSKSGLLQVHAGTGNIIIIANLFSYLDISLSLTTKRKINGGNRKPTRRPGIKLTNQGQINLHEYSKRIRSRIGINLNDPNQPGKEKGHYNNWFGSGHRNRTDRKSAGWDCSLIQADSTLSPSLLHAWGLKLPLTE